MVSELGLKKLVNEWGHLFSQHDKPEELLAICYLTSEGQPDFIWWDKEYFKHEGGSPLAQRVSSQKQVPPEKLFLRLGLFAVCLYDLIRLKIPARNIFEPEENAQLAKKLLDATDYVSSSKRVFKYLMPYKTISKRATLHNGQKQALSVIEEILTKGREMLG